MLYIRRGWRDKEIRKLMITGGFICFIMIGLLVMLIVGLAGLSSDDPSTDLAISADTNDTEATLDPAGTGAAEDGVLAEARTTVHIIPHSHNDLGWLKTLHDYYTGGGEDPDLKGNVSKELDNIIASLSKERSRKFVWANIKFFSMWWGE